MIWMLTRFWFGGRAAIAQDTSDARAVAMRRAGGRCEITGARGVLHGHHLFGVAWFPWLAASPWNIFIMTEELHKSFHAWNGGTAKRCTIFGFWMWRYFHLQWWKGWGAVPAIVVSLVWLQHVQ